jgi:hypothetical protein
MAITAQARTPLYLRKYPGGVDSVVNESMTTGNIYWVHHSGSTTGGYSPTAPITTLDLANNLCTANQGDTIFVMPGHAESISSATACVLDTAGVKIVGLGQGGDRPTLTIDTADTALISIGAASIWLENILIVNNFLDIATSITILAAADNCTLKNIEIKDTSAVLGALIAISVATTVTDLTIDGFMYRQYTTLTAPATNVILFAGTYDRFKLTNSHIQCFTTAAAVDGSAGAGASIYVENVRLIQVETGAGLGLAFHNSTTGFVENVVVVNLKDAVKGLTGTGLSVGQNVMYSNAVNAYAGLFSYTVDS